MKVKIKVLPEFRNLVDADGKPIDLTPRRSTTSAAGFDLRSAANYIVPAATHVPYLCEVCGQVALHVPGRMPIRNGIAMEIEEGYEGQIRPRSGTARTRGIGIPNAPCTVDSDYRGEVVTTLINFGGEPFQVKAGDRMAQILFKEVPAVAIVVVDDLSETKRGEGGFGSTGVK